MRDRASAIYIFFKLRSTTEQMPVLVYFKTLNMYLNSGLPLIRPLFMEFPQDFLLNQYLFIWKQFMFGDSIMVNAIVDPDIRLLPNFHCISPF
jgi:alpha-glucosidase (family GH31 glycosyl hydrolase)